VFFFFLILVLVGLGGLLDDGQLYRCQLIDEHFSVSIIYNHRTDDRRINTHMGAAKTSSVMNVQWTNMQQTTDHKLHQLHYKTHFSFTEHTLTINFLTNSSVSSGTRWLFCVTPSDIALRIAASILDLSVVPGMCVFSLSAPTSDSNSEVWSDGTTSGASVSDSCKEHKTHI
jgi:hypothetical protein